MHELLSQALGRDLLAEVVQLTSDLIRADTTNPPGNETLAVEVLEEYLARNGVESERVARDPARANLIARVRGRGTGPVLALAGHTDVVYADPADWSIPPFAGELHDGHLCGRGALDMKGQTAASAVALAVLARSGWVPNGDVLLIAESDEEDGVDKVGMSWLLQERPDLRCDYALTEANYRHELLDGRTIYTLVVGEKMTMPVRVVARGVAGHASVPTLGDNALVKLAPVLERLSRYAPVLRRSPELDGLLDVVAPGNGALEERIERGRAQHKELWHVLPALAGSTIVPTMVGASRKRNVIPAEAYVEYDCRVLPGTEVEELLGEFRTALAGLDVDLELAEAPLGGTRSPIDTPLRDALAEWVGELEPGALLVPEVSTGFTDAHFLREAFGTIAYGFFPLRYTAPGLLNTVHAPDERIDVRDLELAVRSFVHCIDRIGSVAT
jgi:acetylornithine deacetylase/succinyl-diaminopimelate desuccinylase-like protein